MKKYLLLVLEILFVFVFSSCQEEEKEHPKVKSTQITSTSSASFLLKGELEKIGDYKVIDYGFLYSEWGHLDVLNGSKISLGTNPKPGAFQKEVINTASSVFSQNRKMYFRAFLTNEVGTVYGEVLNAEFPIVKVDGVEPMMGSAGDIISIKGSNFHPGATNYKVLFGYYIQATILQITETEIKVEVPPYVNYSSSITLKIGEESKNVTYDFYIVPK